MVPGSPGPTRRRGHRITGGPSSTSLRQDFFAVLLAAFLAGAFFAAFRAGAFLAVVFLAVVFFAAVRFAAVFLAGAFFAVVFLAVVLLAVVFLAAVRFAVVFLAGAFFAVVFLAAAFFAGAAFYAGAAFLAGALVAVAFLAAFFAGAVAFLAADVDAASVSFGSCLAPETTFFSSAPAVNFGTDVFFALIRAPVWGLRTQRASRTRFSNEPKPVIATFSPLATSRVIVSKTESSACCACLRFPS